MRVPKGPAVGTVALLAALAGCSAERSASAVPTLDVSVSHCGQGWTSPHAGAQTLLLSNTGDVAAEADLIDPGTGAVYQELEGLGPGTTRPLQVTLGGGTYALRCQPDGSDPITGPRVRIAGAARPGPAVTPVTANDLYGPVKAYGEYVAAGLTALVGVTDTLRAAVDDGDLSEARAAWLPAHVAYERLGAAYGTFGDFDGKINGGPKSLPRGARDPGFTGFHRVEYGLWHGESAQSLRGPAAQLASDVRALRADFAHEQTDPADLGLRAHEILENTLQFQLTGDADQGSGTMLATAAANLEGTRKVLNVLRPLLRTRYPGLPGVDTWLDRVGSLLAAQDDGGTWTPLERLSATERQRIDGAVGELLERLAPVATICAVRRTS
jgi:iron uptake system component EfeO